MPPTIPAASLRQLRQSTTPTWLVAGSPDDAVALASATGARRVLVVRDAREFRRVLLEARPRVVVITAGFGDPDSEDLALRERRRRADLRLVHLSAPADVAGRVDALRHGYDDALAESLSPVELAARLERLEASAGRPAGPALLPVAGGFELDPRAHVLRGPDGPVHLRPKEYALLAHLAANPGQAFRREHLLRRIWGAETASTSRTVDVHVRWLRCKIETTPGRPVHLLTVRGVGYRLDPFAEPAAAPSS